jgi:hypothetical protein
VGFASELIQTPVRHVGVFTRYDFGMSAGRRVSISGSVYKAATSGRCCGFELKSE